MTNQNEMHRELAREYAWNLILAAIGIGTGFGVHTLLQTLSPLHGNPLAVSILIGMAMAVFLGALKRMAVEDLGSTLRAESARRSRGLA